MMTVSTSGNIRPDPYIIQIRGTGAGGEDQSVNVTMEVKSLSNRFTLSVSPASQTTPQGYSVDYTVTMTTANNFSGTVTFSAGGQPYSFGGGASFIPMSLSAAGTTTMRVTPGTDSPPGAYEIQVTGINGDRGNFALTSVQVVIPAGRITGQVTSTSGSPISGAKVEWYQDMALLGSVTTDGTGNYTTPDLPARYYTLFCSAPGYKTYMLSPVDSPPQGAKTQNFTLPPAMPGTRIREYVRMGGRVLAVEDTLGDSATGIDLEQYVGFNIGVGGAGGFDPVPLPPWTIGGVTCAGGEVFPYTENLPADTTTVFGTGGFQWCNQCQDTLTVSFSPRVSNLSLLLANGQTFNVTYTIRDDVGSVQTVVIPPNWQSGTATVTFLASSIGQVTITSDAGSAWDFFIDNLRFTPESTPLMQTGAPGTGAGIRTSVGQRPATRPPSPKPAAATREGGQP